ncbi:MAG: methyltransferase domain-containing protein [Colwellia sp.]|nr:methyltransferase domain-containing protein [Colwellia sp.]
MITNTLPYSVSTTISKKQYSEYALPEYLTEHYWWAYLSPKGVGFFDRPYMVNRILWGQYHKIAQDTVDLFSSKNALVNGKEAVAGISCAYGEFFPKLAAHDNVEQLYLFDIAPIQLKQIQKKIPAPILADKCQLFLSNAEQISIANECVDSAILFFLLHELPVFSRANVLSETIRITKPGGRIIIADYAENQDKHFFNRVKIFNSVFEKLEPFLGEFWQCDLIAELSAQAARHGRKVTMTSERYYFNRFYRLLEFTVV